jgi:glutamate/tyrosine decarboxylase-like PLP-dependent enzyme
VSVKSYMIGPKAENLGLFRQLIVEALDDHMYWRRNFYPEDSPAISSADQHSAESQAFHDNLRDLLFTFLADAKNGVPFFSPRYIGHMNTDLLLPALVGYFASMLYNQNNVAGESSPMTAKLEQDVVNMLAEMLGMPSRTGADGEPIATGYLTSGGTTANIYGLWLARNLRSWPVALKLALRHAESRGADGSELARVLNARVVEYSSGQHRQFGDLNAWDLLNLPLQVLYHLRDRCFKAVQEANPRRFPDSAEARRVVETLVGPFTIQSLGPSAFVAKAISAFPDEAAILEKPWKVVVAANKHYSWLKAADVLGLGHQAVHEIGIRSDFTMDVDALDAYLTKAQRERQPVLAVASAFGSTEEGSLDDLSHIDSVRREHESSGLTTWLHVDACYGGYVATLFRGGTGTPLTEWLQRCGSDLGVSAEATKSLVDLAERPGWLSWSDLELRTNAMAAADSISIDPHKLGYVPYPAGAVLLRDSGAWDLVSCDAPYLWRDESAHTASFVGRYTLEGSRPGAVAAGCWLAHRSVPLVRDGHGQIIALSMLAARQLYASLESVRHESVSIAFVNNPHLNMVCYVPYHRDVRTLEELGELVRAVADEYSPAKKRNFMVVQTEVNVETTRTWLRSRFGNDIGDRLFDASDGGCRAIPVLRSVVMGPLSYGATRRTDGQQLFDVFASDLVSTTDSVLKRLRNQAFIRSFRPRDIVLAMDNDPEVHDLLQGALADLRTGHADLRFYGTKSEALREIAEAQTLPFAILDVDMGPGDERGGFEVFEAICRRNANAFSEESKVQSVVFLTVGAERARRHCAAIADRIGQAPRVALVKKPIGATEEAIFMDELWQAMTEAS